MGAFRGLTFQAYRILWWTSLILTLVINFYAARQSEWMDRDKAWRPSNLRPDGACLWNCE